MTNREETRKNSITIPMTEELKQAIVEAAKAEEMTTATWARITLKKALKERGK